MAKKLTEQQKQHKEEQRWLESVQKKLAKYISSPYWDDIHLPNSLYDVLVQIMNTKNVNTLSMSINERVVEHLMATITKQLKQAKENSSCK